MSGLLPADRGATETLTSIRSKLVQLIDSVRWTQALIDAQGHNTLVPWPDLLARYTLLLSHTHATVAQLAQPPHSSQDAASWNKNLAGAVVAPSKPIEADKEWLVGMLLRTRQDVDIEAEAARLIALLPSGLQAAAPQPLAESQPPDLPLKASHLQRTLEAHHSLTDSVLAVARKCRFGASMGEDEDDHFVDDVDVDEEQEGPGYVWNMRLAEEEQEDPTGDGLFSPPPAAAAAAASKELVDLKEVASFLRDGRKGPSVQR